MKRILLLLCVGFCLTLNAEKRIIKETFDESDNKMGWSEFSEKKASALIQDGYYVITQKAAKKPSQIKWAETELPVNVHNNFKISFKLLFDNFNKKTLFAVGNGEGGNTAYFQFYENNIWPALRESGETYKKPFKIILKKGKNKEVLVEWEKKGRNTIISVDGMEVFTTENIKYTSRNFLIQNILPGTIKVDEITIEQVVED